MTRIAQDPCHPFFRLLLVWFELEVSRHKLDRLQHAISLYGLIGIWKIRNNHDVLRFARPTRNLALNVGNESPDQHALKTDRSQPQLPRGSSKDEKRILLFTVEFHERRQHLSLAVSGPTQGLTQL